MFPREKEGEGGERERERERKKKRVARVLKERVGEGKRDEERKSVGEKEKDREGERESERREKENTTIFFSIATGAGHRSIGKGDNFQPQATLDFRPRGIFSPPLSLSFPPSLSLSHYFSLIISLSLLPFPSLSLSLPLSLIAHACGYVFRQIAKKNHFGLFLFFYRRDNVASISSHCHLV